MDWNLLSSILILVVGTACLYFLRNVRWPWRVALVVSMVVLFGVTVYKQAKKTETFEDVWHPKAVAWKQIPVEVYWDRTVFHEYNATFEEAIKVWNERIGCEVLRPVLPRNDATIFIRPFDGNECGKEVISTQIEENPGAPASAWYCNDYVDIQMKRLDELRLVFRITLHELGHAIGLAHDDEGAMAATASEPQMGDFPEYLLPSNKDVKSIKVRYCP